MSPWIPSSLLLLLPITLLSVVHAFVTHPVDFSEGCHGNWTRIILDDNRPLTIESGDIFERLGKTDNFDCRWNIKVFNETNGIFTSLNRLNLRKTNSSSCIDYVKFSLRLKDRWFNGTGFCDEVLSLEGGMDPKTSIKARPRSAEYYSEMMQDLKAFKPITLVNSKGVVMDDKGNFRMHLHVGNSSLNYEENLEFTITISTYPDETLPRRIPIDLRNFYKRWQVEEEAKKAQGSVEKSMITLKVILVLVLKFVLVCLCLIYRRYKRRKEKENAALKAEHADRNPQQQNSSQHPPQRQVLTPAPETRVENLQSVIKDEDPCTGSVNPTAPNRPDHQTSPPVC